MSGSRARSSWSWYVSPRPELRSARYVRRVLVGVEHLDGDVVSIGHEGRLELNVDLLDHPLGQAGGATGAIFVADRPLPTMLPARDHASYRRAR